MPAFADSTGLHPTRIVALPTQFAAACMTSINSQILTAEAGLGPETEKIVQAAALAINNRFGELMERETE